MKTIKTILSFLLSTSLSFFCQANEHPRDVESLEALRAFIEVYEHIKGEYVEKIDDQTLLNHAINGMLTKLDPHSDYLEPRDVSSLRDSTTGSFGGIGIEMDIVDGLIRVIAPIDDSPAARAGILAKDIITHVNNETIRDVNLKKAIETLRGPIGSEVQLNILRKVDGKAEELTISLERAVIRVTSVKQEILPHGIGYLRISQFQNRTGSDLVKAISKLQSQEKLKSLILDLRNNPGGVLSAAIEVVDAFISEGLIVTIKGRDEFLESKYEATNTAILSQEPIVILINGGSASASEIVAGALQDHERAVLIGTPSFGKGSVQTILALENEYALKLTTALYYTPSGRSIQAKGIQPTIQVSGGKAHIESDTQVRETDLPKHLENAGDAGITGDRVVNRLNQDNQLLHAYNLLRGTQLLTRSDEPRSLISP
ncbi:MAG: peptidase S41 [Gammaproteobacteria bacterium]|nr:peptidase S41 [Gammaproteobacteria bacterium]